MNKTLCLLFICSFIFVRPAFAQNIIDAELCTTPIAVNPAFTGMFNGCVRASNLYGNDWATVSIPHVTEGASIDMPVFTDSKGNYLGAGFLVHDDKAGDGNISSFNADLSLAYHKLLGKYHHGYDLAIGLQAGYNQGDVNLLPLFFGPQLNSGSYLPGTSPQYHLNIGNSINYYAVNTGLSLSHGGGKFSYTFGAAVNNINHPNQSIQDKADGTALLCLDYTAEAMANWTLTKRLILSPEVFYENQSINKYFITGNEFRYNLSRNPARTDPTSVFISVCYQSNDIVAVAGGVELKGFRLGLAYNYNIGSLNDASNGQGGCTISLRYIAQRHRSANQKRANLGQ